jgi:NADH-quinone oxidoreductase subunit L
MAYHLYWWILILPLLAFIAIVALVLPWKKAPRFMAGYLTILAIAAALVISILALVKVWQQPDHQISLPVINWLTFGTFSFQVGIIMDSLTAVMLVVVTGVSLMVQIYSLGYMQHDPGIKRFFAWMSLFTAAMLGLVMANNLLMMYVFWELVGLCSYLLIGFWYQRPSAADAAKKAFIITRLGDLGFLIAILVLYANSGTFDTEQIRTMAATGALAGSTLTWAALGIFAGAAGKSAQFPLHTWLPDAMEGPTPVSALIHAATMVAAGVFLVARTFPLFEHSPAALTTIAVIGGLTAFLSAAIGVVMHDIKKVLAYSTISQLGYMMLGLATGGVAIGIFHLFNHAFFKALLFMGAGSIQHSTGTYDMREMGGLRKSMPWTCWLFVIGSLSLVGIWPLAGFWSKDAILEASLHHQPILFVLAMITVFLTAFYSFRMIFLTFGGKEKSAPAGNTHELHESPWIMLAPMAVLGVLAVISGFWNVTGQFSLFLGAKSPHTGLLSGVLGVLVHPLPLVALATSALGIFSAWGIYSAGWSVAVGVKTALKPLNTLLTNKYWLDVLYENIIVKKILLNWLFAKMQWFDTSIIDGSANGLAHTHVGIGGVLKKIQNGQLQLYALSIGIGLIAIIVGVLLFGT